METISKKPSVVESKKFADLIEYVSFFHLLFLSKENKDLNDILPYSPGTITKRVLIKNKAGLVELLSFDKGQIWKPQDTPNYIVLQVIEGSAQIKIDNEIIRPLIGKFVYIPPKANYQILAMRRMRLLKVIGKQTSQMTSPIV